MKIFILHLSILFASGLFFVNVYNSLVDARSWGANIPASIATAREYAKEFNPGTFFKLISPVSQLLAIASLVLCWKYPIARLLLGAALVSYVLAEVFTVKAFVPRNDVMFRTGSLTDVQAITRAWTEWSRLNWVRSLLLLIGLVFSSLSLHALYTKAA